MGVFDTPEIMIQRSLANCCRVPGCGTITPRPLASTAVSAFDWDVGGRLVSAAAGVTGRIPHVPWHFLNKTEKHPGNCVVLNLGSCYQIINWNGLKIIEYAYCLNEDASSRWATKQVWLLDAPFERALSFLVKRSEGRCRIPADPCLVGNLGGPKSILHQLYLAEILLMLGVQKDTSERQCQVKPKQLWKPNERFQATRFSWFHLVVYGQDKTL